MPNSSSHDARVPSPPPAPPLPPAPRRTSSGNRTVARTAGSHGSQDSPAKDYLARIARLATSKPPPITPHYGRLPDLKAQKRFDVPLLHHIFKPALQAPRTPLLKESSPLRRVWPLSQALKLPKDPPKAKYTDKTTSSPAVSRTVTHKTGIPIASLDISPDRTRAVLAGREILKIIHVTNDSCIEEHNLRAAISAYAAAHGRHEGPTSAAYKNNTAANDVKWSHGSFDRKIAIAGANGRIAILDLEKTGLEWARLDGHSRQVHRLGFNPFEGSLLLSGSQDATVRLWDLRCDAGDRSVTAMQSRVQFPGNSDVIRDVRWSPTNVFDFAIGTDAGMIQRWDIRKHNAPLLRTRAHERPCYAVDWHPDGKHLVSAGADKDVKVWDFSLLGRKIKPLCSLRAPQAVTDVRWRPIPSKTVGEGKDGLWQSTQLATAFDKEDPRVVIWDLDQPYVPFRTFDHYDLPPTSLLWHSDQLLWSVGTHGIFTQMDFETLTKPRRRPRHHVHPHAGGSVLYVHARQPQSLLKDRNGQSSTPGNRPVSSEEGEAPEQQEIIIAKVIVPPLEREAETFKFFATQYKFVPDPSDLSGPCLHLTLRDMLMRNAHLASEIGMSDLSFSWQALAFVIHKELLARATRNRDNRRATAASEEGNNSTDQADDALFIADTILQECTKSTEESSDEKFTRTAVSNIARNSTEDRANAPSIDIATSKEVTNSTNSTEDIDADQFMPSDFAKSRYSKHVINSPLSVPALLDKFCNAQIRVAKQIQHAVWCFLIIYPYFNSAGEFPPEIMVDILVDYHKQLRTRNLALQARQLRAACDRVFALMYHFAMDEDDAELGGRLYKEPIVVKETEAREEEVEGEGKEEAEGEGKAAGEAEGEGEGEAGSEAASMNKVV